ncbi:hypothetical protein C0995_008233 [Termitomyces sp. Mi166|nr:hypothetical protein C0995_008233 [Termitomyces sp. Mi166\
MEEKKYQKLGAVGMFTSDWLGIAFGGATAIHLGLTGLVQSIVICHPGPFSIEQAKAIKVTSKLPLLNVEEPTTSSRTAHGFAARPNLSLTQVTEAHEKAFQQAVDWCFRAVPCTLLKTKNGLLMLEVAAIHCTDENGNQVAPSIEGCPNESGLITLVFANNGNADNLDQKIVEAFLDRFRCHYDFQPALKFLVIHCEKTSIKRFQAFRNTFFDELQSSVANYRFTDAVHSEIPGLTAEYVGQYAGWNGMQLVQEVRRLVTLFSTALY